MADRYFQVLIHNPSAIQWYTHIILDEVHERSMDTDFAMLVVRRLLSTRQRTKIILMSATLQGDMLTKYFEETFHYSLVSSPYFVGAKRYPVKQCFYDDLSDLADNCTSSDKKSYQFLKNASQTLQSKTWQDSMVTYPSVTEINMDVCTHLVVSQSNLGESVLVFLPGIASISLYYDRLAQYRSENNLDQKFKLFILHSQVPFEEQKDAFECPASDVVNVILATNIAESSITLPKLRMVINFGIYHQLNYDPKRRTSCLKRRWCSRASCAQRAGRAGRVCDGIVIHLFSKKFHDKVLSTYDPPEILTAPLAKLILQVKMICKQLGEPSPSRFLSDAIEFPPMEQIGVALRDLSELGAIASNNTNKDQEVDEEANITFLGYFCLALPVELSLCRLVLYSILLGIPFEGIVVAASLSLYQDIFSRPSSELLNPEGFLQKLKVSTTCRVTFDGGHYSHAVQICTLFRKWIEFRNANLCTVSGNSRFSLIRAFCMNAGVRWERLFQLESAVATIAGKVMAYIPEGHAVHTELLNLTKLTDHRRDFMVHRHKKKTAQYSEICLNFCEDVVLVKALMVCSFSNQLLIGKSAVNCSSVKRMKKAQSAVKTMTQCGMNPSQTLVLHNLKNPTIPSLQFLALSILPERHCNVMVHNDMGFISLVPKLQSMVQTAPVTLQAGIRGEHFCNMDTQNSPWNPFMMEESVVQQKLSPDIVLLWQYGENKPSWKVSGLQDAFPRASHPYHICWERLSQGNERAYTSNWRQPVQSLVDLGQNDDTFFAVAATLQGSNHDRVVSVSDITVLPNNDKESCLSILLVLAFQPPTASIKFLFNKEHHICGMKIENQTIYFRSSQILTLGDIVRINRLRKAMSEMLSSCNTGDGEILFHMDKVSKIQSLLNSMLRRTPANLVSEIASPNPCDMVWELVGFGYHSDVDEDLVSENGSDELDEIDALDNQESYNCDEFYPPMKLAILSKAVINEDPSRSFRTNSVFSSCSDSVQDVYSQGNLRRLNSDFKLSPLAKSFVPQGHLSRRARNPIESKNFDTVNATLAPPREQFNLFSSNDVTGSPIDFVSDEVQTGPQPKEMQLKIFQPYSATSSGAKSSSAACQNSYDISKLASFFPQGFSGFGDFTASYRGHFNPCVVLQANPSSRIVNQRTNTNIVEFEVPTISVWRGMESLAQVRRNFNQCLLLFGEMLMSKLRLRQIDYRSPMTLTQGQRNSKDSNGSQVSGENARFEKDLASNTYSNEADSGLNKDVASSVCGGSPTENFMLGGASPSQQAHQSHEDPRSVGIGMPRIFRPISRSSGQHESFSQFSSEIQQTEFSGRIGRPQPCMRYNPPVYIPPPAFSVIQSQAQRRIPPGAQCPGRSKHKQYGKSRHPPAQFVPAAYNSRYHHPLWLSNMLCAPPKMNPCDIYAATKVECKGAKGVAYSENDFKLTCSPGFIPPVGSILNSEHAGTFVVHKSISKKDKQKPPHQIYGVDDDLLASFYYDYLKVVGKTPVATLIGPIYRQWLLNTCSVSLDISSRLPFNFFEKYPKKFSLLVEKDQPVVQVAQEDSFDYNCLPSCMKTSESDDGVGSVSSQNDRHVPGSLDLNCVSNSDMSLATASHFEDEVSSVVSRSLEGEHLSKKVNVSEDHTEVAAWSEVAAPSAASYSDNSKVLDLILPPPPGFGPMNLSVSSKVHNHIDNRSESIIGDECCVLAPQCCDQNNENSIPYYPYSQAPCESLSEDVLFGESTPLTDLSGSPDIVQPKEDQCSMQGMTSISDESPLVSESTSAHNLDFSPGHDIGENTDPVAESAAFNITHPVEELIPAPSLPSGSVLSNLHQALLDYGIHNEEKLDTLMKTIEQMKVTSEVIGTQEVVDPTVLSSGSSDDDLNHETDIGNYHFPSALLTPGNSENDLLNSRSHQMNSTNVQTEESHDNDTVTEPKASSTEVSYDLEVYKESNEISYDFAVKNSVQCENDYSSLAIVHSTLPLVSQEVPTVPLVSQEDPTISLVSQEHSIVLLVSQEDPTVSLVSQEHSTVPLVSQDHPTVPLVSQEDPTVPLVSQEHSTVPLVSQDHPTLSLVSQEDPTVPLVSQEDPTVPLVSQEPSSVPIVSQEPSTVPIVSQEPSTVPLVSHEHSTVPLVSQEHLTLPLVSQESGMDSQDPTASYLLSIITQNTDLLPFDSSLDDNKYGAIYCSSLEKSLPEKVVLDSNNSSRSQGNSVSEGLSIGDRLCSGRHQDTGEVMEELYCLVHSDNLESNYNAMDCQKKEIHSSDISEDNFSLQKGESVDFSDASAMLHSRRFEDSEVWSAYEEDDQNSQSVPDPNTESHSWPDLIENESFLKSAYSDTNSLDENRNADVLPSDGDIVGTGNSGRSCYSACGSLKSADSWPGVEQEIPVAESTSSEIHPSVQTCLVVDVSSSDAAIRVEKAWSADHTNSAEEKKVAPECDSRSVCLSADNSSDWIEMPKGHDNNSSSDHKARSTPSKLCHSKSSSSNSLPDQEWYVPPQRKIAQYTEQQSAALLECMKRILKDGPLTFNSIVAHYRSNFPNYPYLCRDYFYSNPQHYTCTVSSRNDLSVSLCGNSATGSCSVKTKKKQPCAGSSASQKSSQSTSPSSPVEVTPSVEQDRKIVLKEVSKVIRQNKSNRIRCSQVRRRISIGLRPSERLDRRFFERHSSLFEIEEIRYKREGDENDFFVSLVTQKIVSSHPYPEHSRSGKPRGNKTRSRSQSRRGQGGAIRDDSEVQTAHGEGSASVPKSSESKAKGGASNHGEDKKKKKKKKHKIEHFQERVASRDVSRRHGLRGRGGYRGEPLYVYGSGLPFYCSKAESESEL